MKKDFLILGASGMQGKIVARDLLEKNYSVLLTDIYKEGSQPSLQRFPKNASFKFLDVRQIKKVVKTIKDSGAKVVINCAEGDWNALVYKACLTANAHVVDLGSRTDVTIEQIKMNPLFIKKGLIAITGCGSTPGINNVMLSFAAKQFDQIETIHAGFVWDSNVKKFVVPFSIESIIEEFTWPAPVIEDGEWKTRMPLENITVREFKTIGRQDIFLVDHSETYTFFHYYKDKGVKDIRFYAGFPDHSTKTILSLIELGFANTKKIMVDGQKVSPMATLTQVLRELPKPEGYSEKENLWVEISGTNKHGKSKKVLMECIVPTLPGWEDSGCNIDTGLPASIIAQMIKDGRIATPGSHAPEGVVPEEELFRELRAKEMFIYQNRKLINGTAADLELKPNKAKSSVIPLEA